MEKKRLFIAIASLFFLGVNAQSQDPVLMKVNNRPVKKSEFEYLYHKNNAATNQSIDDYLGLFVDYKLKVEEALNQKLDTTKSFVKEYESYKRQVIQPYLTDTISDIPVAKEAYNRMAENIEVSHILVAFPRQVLLPKDTLEYYNKALSIREKLVGKNAMSFEAAAKEYSKDPTAAEATRPGYMGWTTSLMFVAPFENGMYATKTGQISMPVRSTFGYHLIKVHNRRPDPGKVNVSHIMFSFPERNSTEQQMDSVKAVAQNIYNKLQAGGNYAELCKEYSSDKRSAEQNGSLGWIRTGMGLPPEFMSAAYTLKDTNTVTAPVKTDFGYHLIKIQGKESRDSWEEMKPQIVRQINSSDWSDKINNERVKNLSSKVSHQLNQPSYAALINWANSYSPMDSLFLSKIENNSDVLLTVANQKYTLKDFSDYLKRSANYKYNLSTDIVKSSVENFTYTKLRDGYSDAVATLYPELSNLLQEYHDGILLFNVMNEEVWEKAANDTVGLTKYFETHKSKYKWDASRYKGYIVYCKDETALKEANKLAKKVKKGENLNAFLKESMNNDSVSVVFARRGVWAKGDNKFIDELVFKTGEKPEPMKEYPYYFVTGGLISAPEEYSDVKGLVISDLQEQKEKEWLSQLKNRYKVEIDQKVLQSLK